MAHRPLLFARDKRPGVKVFAPLLRWPFETKPVKNYIVITARGKKVKVPRELASDGALSDRVLFAIVNFLNKVGVNDPT